MNMHSWEEGAIEFNFYERKAVINQDVEEGSSDVVLTQ